MVYKRQDNSGQCLSGFWESNLNQLGLQASLHPPKSIQRRRALTKLILAIKDSKKLWRENTPYYEDALQQTWFYLCRNLCEAETAKNSYDPEKGSVITWINAYLKHRLKDFQLQKIKELKNTEPKRIDNKGQEINLVDNFQHAPMFHRLRRRLGNGWKRIQQGS